MTVSPCTDCTSRHVGCHADCEDYAAWRVEYDESRKTEIAAKCKDSMITSYNAAVVRKVQRRQRGK